ncbi:MAG: hypothetical protein AAFX76_01725 [Planctomycetota bacterium]
MTHRTRLKTTAPAFAAAALLAGPAAGQSSSYFSYDYQVPVSQRATFNVTGAAANGDVQGDAFLSSVVYPDGSEYTQYYLPVDVTDMVAESGQGNRISIRGGNNITDGVPGRRTIGGFADGKSRSTITSDDVEGFEDALRSAMASKNLNYYFDMSGNPDFGYTVKFEIPVRDDDPEPDIRGELLYFERGTGGGNSWLTFQAVDENGNALGPALAISPEETFPTTPVFSVYRADQQFGGLAIDVSRLGVDSVQYLRIRRTVSTDDGYGPISRGGVDLQPDCKIMAVITHPDDLTILAALYD